MSGQHTPGPWSLAPAHVIIGANGMRICQVPVRLDANDVADLRLIAAAPELLEALERLLADCGEAMSDGYVENSIHINEVELGRAVIAKARGDA